MSQSLQQKKELDDAKIVLQQMMKATEGLGGIGRDLWLVESDIHAKNDQLLQEKSVLESLRKELEEFREKRDQEKKEEELKILLDELEDVKKQQNEERVAQEGVKKDIEGIQTQIDIAKNEEEKKTMIHKELANDMTRVHDKWTQTKSTYELHSKAVLALQQENEGIKSQHAELLEVIHSLTTRSTQLQQTLLEKESVVRETIGAGNQEMLTHLKQKRKDLETYCVSLGTELETSRLEEALSTMKKEKEEIEKEVQKLSSSSKESRITDEDMKGLFDRKRQLEKELYSLQTTPIDVGNDPEIHSVSNDWVLWL